MEELLNLPLISFYGIYVFHDTLISGVVYEQ